MVHRPKPVDMHLHSADGQGNIDRETDREHELLYVSMSSLRPFLYMSLTDLEMRQDALYVHLIASSDPDGMHAWMHCRASASRSFGSGPCMQGLFGLDGSQAFKFGRLRLGLLVWQANAWEGGLSSHCAAV